MAYYYLIFEEVENLEYFLSYQFNPAYQLGNLFQMISFALHLNFEGKYVIYVISILNRKEILLHNFQTLFCCMLLNLKIE